MTLERWVWWLLIGLLILAAAAIFWRDRTWARELWRQADELADAQRDIDLALGRLNQLAGEFVRFRADVTAELNDDGAEPAGRHAPRDLRAAG